MQELFESSVYFVTLGAHVEELPSRQFAGLGVLFQQHYFVVLLLIFYFKKKEIFK